MSIWKCFCSLTENSKELNTKNIVTLLTICATLLIMCVATLLTQLPATPINPHLEEQGLPAFADEPEDKQLLDKPKYPHKSILIIHTLCGYVDEAMTG